MTRAQWACSEADAQRVFQSENTTTKEEYLEKKKERKKSDVTCPCASPPPPPLFFSPFLSLKSGLARKTCLPPWKNGELMLDPLYNNATPPQMCWGYCNSVDSNWEYSVNRRKRYCCKSFRLGVIASLAQLLFVLALIKSVIISTALLFQTDST